VNLVDSSGWLAYFADEPNAGIFLEPLKEPDALIVPTITLYEVFKVVLRESGENDALQAIAAMQRGRVVELTPSLAITAARISQKRKLPMADSIILATARAFEATIWTQDADFKGLENVRYFEKGAGS